MDKSTFAIFNPQYELVKNVPTILLSKVLLSDSQNILMKDDKIIRRKMREKILVDIYLNKVQTPDTFPIIHYHTFTKRSTNVQYQLVFTKAHIYHWNPTNKTLDLIFTCSGDCENWESVNYNDKIIVTNNIDLVLIWDTTGNFIPLGSASGIEYSTGFYLTKAKHLTVYENYLIFGFTYENGLYYPQRIRWNDIGDETNWLTGSKGSVEIGMADIITGFGLYQGNLVVFKASSYYKVWLVGYPFWFNTLIMSDKIGCQCSGSIVNDNKGRLYWFASDGTFKEMSVGTISQLIQTDVVDKIFPSSIPFIKSDFVDKTEEVWWSIPFETSQNSKVLTFKEGKWGQLNLMIPAFGSYMEE